MLDFSVEHVLARLLDVIDDDILPMTAQGVAAGNKIFGAALLQKSDLSLVVAETNNEMENPLWHGEMHALKRFYEMPTKQRPATKDLIFLSTHEPCSLCLSAITWAGFDNFYYLFSHEDSRDSFAIPHDLRILKAVFDCDPGGYNKTNEFWESYALANLLGAISDEALKATLQKKLNEVCVQYDVLSAKYQGTKDGNDIPLN